MALTNVTLANNTSAWAGGGLFNDFGTVTFSNDNLTNNSAHYGGGIYTLNTATLTNVTLTGNSAVNGGGIVNGGTITLTNVTLANNSATNQGGGVANNGPATLTNVTFSGNSATNQGGGIYNNPGVTAVLNTVTLSGNSAKGAGAWGGGIYNHGTMALTNVTLSGNTAAWAGGGLFNDFGKVTLSNDSLTNNVANYGGGIYTFDTAILSNVTLEGNSAKAHGGGIVNGGTITLTNVTVAGNSAAGQGGGITNNGPAALINVTFSGNSASVGGGIYNNPGITAVLNNTIVANSTSGGAISGAVSGRNNLIDDASHSGGLVNGTNGNLVGVNPRLAALGNYGGPTQTMPLLPGSPAIDAGSTALAVDAQGHLLTTDQRGQARVVGAAVDIGAFESSGFTLTVAAGNNQTTPVRTAFPTALRVTVAPKHAGDPVDGGLVTFTAPASGASATFSPSGPVTIASGAASVAATANSTAGGPYAVKASATGASPVSFSLTNTGSSASSSLPAYAIVATATQSMSTWAAGPTAPLMRPSATSFPKVRGITVPILPLTFGIPRRWRALENAQDRSHGLRAAFSQGAEDN